MMHFASQGPEDEDVQDDNNGNLEQTLSQNIAADFFNNLQQDGGAPRGASACLPACLPACLSACLPARRLTVSGRPPVLCRRTWSTRTALPRRSRSDPVSPPWPRCPLAPPPGSLALPLVCFTPCLSRHVIRPFAPPTRRCHQSNRRVFVSDSHSCAVLLAAKQSRRAAAADRRAEGAAGDQAAQQQAMAAEVPNPTPAPHPPHTPVCHARAHRSATRTHAHTATRLLLRPVDELHRSRFPPVLLAMSSPPRPPRPPRHALAIAIAATLRRQGCGGQAAATAADETYADCQARMDTELRNLAAGRAGDSTPSSPSPGRGPTITLDFARSFPARNARLGRAALRLP